MSNSHFIDNDLQLIQGSQKFKEAITTVRWAHPQAEHDRLFAVGTQDGQLRIYNIEDDPVNNNPVIVQKFIKPTKWPIVDIAWGEDNSSLYYSTLDNTVQEVDLSKPTGSTKVAQHDALIRNIFYSTDAECLVTASFDKSIKVWDLSSEKQAKQIPLQHKPYATDLRGQVLATALSNAYISTMNVFNPTVKQTLHESILGRESALQSIALNPDGSLMAFGSVDGRVSLSNLNQNPMTTSVHQSHLFSFKAEKQEMSKFQGKGTIMHPINCIGFNTRNPKWFFTGTSFSLSSWNYQSKNRIDSTPVSSPITTAELSPSGMFLAYAQGNDYHLGPDIQPNYTTSLRVHYISGIEVTKLKWE